MVNFKINTAGMNQVINWFTTILFMILLSPEKTFLNEKSPIFNWFIFRCLYNGRLYQG